jgi:hypothetical protein
MANIFPYALYSGDPIPVDLIFYDLIKDPTGGTVLDLTGSHVGLTVKVNATDPDAEAVYTNDIAGTTSGTITFSVPSPEPGNYVLDVKWWNSANVRSNILQDAFTINQSVTQRAAPGAVTSFSITSINPTSAPTGFSEQLDVYGGIFSATTVIKFNTVAMTTTFVDTDHVSCTVTPISGANAVLCTDGTHISNSMTLTGT